MCSPRQPHSRSALLLRSAEITGTQKDNERWHSNCLVTCSPDRGALALTMVLLAVFLRFATDSLRVNFSASCYFSLSS